MYTGACLCGEIKFNIHQNINKIFICHCQQCQKAQGSAFVAVVTIDLKNFQLLSGENFLTEFFYTPNKRRVFCKQCASPIFSARLDLPNVIRLRVGIIDQQLNEAQVYSHAFTDEKACWFDLPEDGSIRFEKASI